jgi:hypothetical protein
MIEAGDTKGGTLYTSRVVEIMEYASSISLSGYDLVAVNAKIALPSFTESESRGVNSCRISFC